MSIISRETTQEEVAAAVCDALSRADISVVLSGGSVVSIYSENEYASYDLDFIPVGLARKVDAVVTQFAERRTRLGVLRLLAPTECVMDRPAGYYHWDDAQCLDQALAVARRHPIDLARVEAWSAREASLEKFRMFRERLERMMHPGP